MCGGGSGRQGRALHLLSSGQAYEYGVWGGGTCMGQAYEYGGVRGALVWVRPMSMGGWGGASVWAPVWVRRVSPPTLQGVGGWVGGWGQAVWQERACMHPFLYPLPPSSASPPSILHGGYCCYCLYYADVTLVSHVAATAATASPSIPHGSYCCYCPYYVDVTLVSHVAVTACLPGGMQAGAAQDAGQPTSG